MIILQQGGCCDLWLTTQIFLISMSGVSTLWNSSCQTCADWSWCTNPALGASQHVFGIAACAVQGFKYVAGTTYQILLWSSINNNKRNLFRSRYRFFKLRRGTSVVPMTHWFSCIDVQNETSFFFCYWLFLLPFKETSKQILRRW